MLASIVIASAFATSNVRSTDPMIAKALSEGLVRSPVIRRLVDAIDASDVIVYIARGVCPSPAVACLMMTGTAAGVRYVRINFTLEIGLGKKGGWNRDELSVMIAHELQHAVEIAEWPEVVDHATLTVAYARRGVVLGESRLDTLAAEQAGNERRAELQQRRR